MNLLINEMNKKYGINKEDICLILLSNYGININLPFSRIRFLFFPENRDFFNLANEMKISNMFLALPINSNSPFSIRNGCELYLLEIYLGKVQELYNDTCDTHYTRNEGRVINLNPVSKSQCHGCKFCHTIVQDANDIKIDISNGCMVELFFRNFIEEHKIEDLSSIIQIALVTGGFGCEEKLVNYIKLVAQVALNYNFSGEILYFGAELTETGLRKLSDIGVELVYCYTIECFTNRQLILKSIKAKKTIQDIIRFFDKSRELGFKMTFSYVLGIDALDIINKEFENIVKHVDRFPIINIFQPHKGIDCSILDNEAHNVEYYLKARQIIEEVFINTDLRPRTWENYRSLWYFSFANESLVGSRLP